MREAVTDLLCVIAERKPGVHKTTHRDGARFERAYCAQSTGTSSSSSSLPSPDLFFRFETHD